jgi:hypothetical protein
VEVGGTGGMGGRGDDGTGGPRSGGRGGTVGLGGRGGGAMKCTYVLSSCVLWSQAQITCRSFCYYAFCQASTVSFHYILKG